MRLGKVLAASLGILLCSLIALRPGVSYGAKQQTVTAVGRAEVIGSNKSGARNAALAGAFREAVEKGIGVWVQGQTEVKDAMLVKDQILTHAEGYVTEHEIIKESVEGGTLTITISAQVAVDRIGADIRSLVARVSTQMGNPSVTFVLTTWEKRGQKGAYERSTNRDLSVREDVKSDYDTGREKSDSSTGRDRASIRERGEVDARFSSRDKASREARAGVSGDGNNESVARVEDDRSSDSSVKGSLDRSRSRESDRSSDSTSSSRRKGFADSSLKADKSSRVNESGSYAKIDEDLWVKYPSSTVIDSFNQEFKEKNFDLMATDKAMEIANSKSLTATSVNPFDRKSVRETAEKEGANYVARGELQVLDTVVSESTGNTEVTSQINVQIIDVGSGDIVASYTNTATASSSRPMESKSQSIKKISTLAARTLAGQTIDTWQKRSLNGRQYVIEVRNIKSRRSQERPILNAIESLAQITGTTNPQKDVLLVKVLFKGEKKRLEDSLLDQLGSKPGFSEKEFDGPFTEEGKIVFIFK